MDFRIVQGSSVLRLLAGTAKVSRNLGLGAALCAVLGTSAFAQATLDFIDPLDTERVRIEERSGTPDRAIERRDPPPPRFSAPPVETGDSVLTRARDGVAAGAGAAREGASGFLGTLRSTLSSIAAALGLPTVGLVALLGLLVAGFAALVGWTLFRGNRRSAEIPRDDVYARSSREAVKRRAMGSTVTPKAAVVAREDDFEETMPEDFDEIFADETGDLAPRRQTVEKGETGTWRKPNLDRLRESIKADWKADKAEKAEVPAPVSATAPRTQPRAAAVADPAMRSLDDLSDGWEDWDTQDKPEDDPWGETLPVAETARKDGDETATSRIRALRESLRAS